MQELLGGRYRLEGELRGDGDLVVYAATDTRLNRPVTVKLLRPERAGDQAFLSDWSQAVSRAAALTQANIVPIYDLDLDGDSPYVVEPRTEGRTVGELIDGDTPFTVDEVKAVAVQCGRALAAAHQAGLVHGCVAPDSMIVDADGAVHLTDFARPPSPNVTPRQAPYLAPEQNLGAPPDARSDVYGLAATLYHLLAGEPVFDGPNAVAIGTLQQTRDPFSVTVRRPETPHALADAVDQALSREPSLRPADGGAFLSALAAPAPPRVPPPPMPDLTTVMTRVDLPPVGAAAPQPTPQRPPQPSYAPPPPEPVREPGGGAGPWVAMLLILAVGGLLWVAITKPGASIPVPSLAGMTEAQATAALTGLALKGSVVGTEHDAIVPGGQVLRQDPPAGTKLREGEVVSLVLSKGPSQIIVPSLVRLPESDARKRLPKVGLAYGGSETVNDPSFDDGVVVAQLPPAGQPVAKGTPIKLYVNSKPDEPATEEPPTGEDTTAPATNEDTTAPPADGESGEQPKGLVDEALERVGERAKEAVGDLADKAKDKLREAGKDAVDRIVGGDSPDSKDKPAGQ